MNESEEKIQIVKNFIFNDDISKSINNINQNFLDLNILDITGMGTQEIKHSSILAWLLGDNEHKLGYQVFTEFLKSIYSENSRSNDNFEDELDELQSYIYLAHKDELKVYREKDHIDLLIEDKNNKKIFVIENKVLAGERINGEDGGQLKKYEKTVEEKYSGYKKYYIFLTPGLEDASRPKWLNASYQMIVDVIKNLDSKELSEKVKFVLESYVDLLKRKNIVANKKIEELAMRIWENPEYKKALEIINNYKPDIFYDISKYIQEKLESYNSSIALDDSTKNLIRFKDTRWNCDAQSEGNGWTSNNNVLLYEFQNGRNGLFLKLFIGPSNNDTFRQEIFNISSKPNKFTPGNKLSTKWNQIWKKSFISKNDITNKNFEELKEIIDDEIKIFFSEDNHFDKNYNILSTVMSK